MAVAIIILIVLYFFSRKSKSKPTNTNQPLATKKSVPGILENKIILISNTDQTDIKQVLENFCHQYNQNDFNQDDYAVVPRLYQLSETEYAVTFPYSVSLSTFCFAINYLKYLTDSTGQVEVQGWATIYENEDITEPSLMGKVCMFYLVDDKEYDNVYITSSDNFCYKLPFTNFKLKAISPPAELFKNRPAKLADLSSISYEDIE